MSRPERITPDLQQAHAANRLAIARARQEAVFVLRGEKRAEIAALAERMAAEAQAEGCGFDFETFTRESNRIDSEYTRREIEQFGLPVGVVGGRGEQPMKPDLRGWGRI